MGNMESQLVISCHQARLLLVGLDCSQFIVAQRGSHENFQTIHTVAKTMGCPLLNLNEGMWSLEASILCQQRSYKNGVLYWNAGHWFSLKLTPMY